MASVLVSVEAGVQTLTLNRPEKLNAFTPEMHKELRRALEQALDDHAIGAVLLTGAGRGFCSGQDLAERNVAPGAAPIDLSVSLGSYYNPLVRRMRELPKPIVCAVNGVAAGAGANIALACDIVLAARSASFVQSFARLGLVPDSGGTYFLPRVVGINRAAEWVYTGRVFDADEARAAGLVSRVVAPEALLDTARALAEEMADGTSAMSVALARQMLWRMLGAAHPMDAHRVDSRAIFWMGQSPDAHEGVASFLEKRPPRFTLRPSRDMPPWRPDPDPRLAQLADDIRVVREPQLRMQPADDVEFAGWGAAGLLGLLIDLRQRAGIGIRFFRGPRERTEHAGVPQHADVGRIEVLVGGEEDPVAVNPLIGERGELTQTQDIGGVVESDPLGGVEPLARQHFLGDRPESGIAKAGRIGRRDSGHVYLRSRAEVACRCNLAASPPPE